MDTEYVFLAHAALSSKKQKRADSVLRYSSWLIRRITIPALQNAPILPSPSKSKRWPVLVFSHGLGGTCNSYSQITGSLSSHGIIVVAPEHRDGSGPITFVRDETGPTPSSSVEYQRIAHDATPEVLGARGKQLKIRLWEFGLIYDLLARLDAGQAVTNLNKDPSDLTIFRSILDIHRPGAMTWAGHSFGAASVVQFVKSIYYASMYQAPAAYKPLYLPLQDSQLVRQITPMSVMVLLDIWMLPLTQEDTHWLLDQPLPCYFLSNENRSTSVLAILSEGFFKWNSNLVRTKEMLSAKGRDNLHAPHICYAESSVHFSQSDFGVLFPWLTKVAFKAKDPERILRLNVRAILELMRRNGQEVADTPIADLEIEEKKRGTTGDSEFASVESKTLSATIGQDSDILLRDGSVRGWIALDLDEENKPGEGRNKRIPEGADPIDAVMEEEVNGSSKA